MLHILPKHLPIQKRINRTTLQENPPPIYRRSWTFLDGVRKIAVPEEFRVRPDLRRTDLRRANLTGNLIGANFFRANLAGAFLIQANLVQANFFRADLTGADLFRADLANADLERADLTGVRDLTQEQLEQAIGDATTKLPEGFTRPASWTTGTDEQADGDE